MARTLKDYPSVALKTEDLDGKIDFARIFGRPGPVHIEIGTGKATFLLNEAMSQPNVNFLGIERARKYYRFAVDRIGRWDLKNVRI
ncbi:MAG: tRNA (guanosine(46)-N7)-methyltransferase TrmB, partial [Planctomycetota bacterium]